VGGGKPLSYSRVELAPFPFFLGGREKEKNGSRFRHLLKYMQGGEKRGGERKYHPWKKKGKAFRAKRGGREGQCNAFSAQRWGRGKREMAFFSTPKKDIVLTTHF